MNADGPRVDGVSPTCSSSFPPSASLFAAPGPLAPILAQLRRTKSPFVIEIDPYLAWRQSYSRHLSRSLFDLGPESPPQFVDAGSGSSYRNLFDAMLDAVRWALYAEGYGDLDIVVGKVGWPSGPAARPGAGDAADDSDGATVENAALFNSRLAAHMGGPPLTPDVDEADWGPAARRPAQSSLSPDDERKRRPDAALRRADSAH
ncbi:glycosyl hydrolase [Aureococcus anophagefferens]|nr:glycosyl hydrolase [Aureococcus anophagefferens]